MGVVVKSKGVLFKAILTKKVVDDTRLFVGLGICVMVDVICLTIFGVLEQLSRVYIDANENDLDDLRWEKYQYGACAFNQLENINENNYNLANWSIYGFLLFFKLCELMFGIYVALDVSRIKDITGMLTRFDETGIQLLSILCTFSIFIFAIPVFAFGPTEEPDFYYLVIAISVIVIGNIVIFLNLSPRVFAVMCGNDQNYLHSPIKRMEIKLKKQLSTFEMPNADELPEVYKSEMELNASGMTRTRTRTGSKEVEVTV